MNKFPEKKELFSTLFPKKVIGITKEKLENLVDIFFASILIFLNLDMFQKNSGKLRNKFGKK